MWCGTWAGIGNEANDELGGNATNLHQVLIIILQRHSEGVFGNLQNSDYDTLSTAV